MTRSSSQHGFARGCNARPSLITFWDAMARCADKGSAVDAVYLDFSKAFSTLFHSTLVSELEHYSVDGQTAI